MTPYGTLRKHPVGRPRVRINPEQVSQLRNQGSSWRQIAKTLGIGTTTAMRLIRSRDEARPNTQHMSPKTADELKRTTLGLENQGTNLELSNVKVEANGGEVRPHDRSVVGIIVVIWTLPRGLKNIKQIQKEDLAPAQARDSETLRRHSWAYDSDIRFLFLASSTRRQLRPGHSKKEIRISGIANLEIALVRLHSVWDQVMYGSVQSPPSSK